MPPSIQRILRLKDMEVTINWGGRGARRSFRVVRSDEPTNLVFQSLPAGTPMSDHNSGHGISSQPPASWASPELKLAVSSLRSRHWPCPRRLQDLAGINVPDAILVGRFSGDNHWPVLGDR